MQAGNRYAVSYSLKNSSAQPWDPDILAVGIRWFSVETGKQVSSARRKIPKQVAPGDSIDAEDVMIPPPDLGIYRLAIGIVEENVRWVVDRADNETTVRVIESPRDPARVSPAGRIRLIGLDGATWDILMPWIRAGKLPNFERVIRNGSWGPLRSLPGTLSPVMWTSIATGYERETHGIDDFQVRDGYEMRLVRSTDRKVPAIWNIASEYNLESHIVNWMVTDPPEPIEGIMVSRLRKIEDTGVYPPELSRSLARISDTATSPINESEDPAWAWRRFLHRDLERLIAIERFLAELNPPGFAAYYTHSTDEIQHRFWKYMEPESFRDPFFQLDPHAIATHGDAIFDLYARVDEWIGETWDADEEILVLVSDHGAQAATMPRAYLATDRLLADLGFASLVPSGDADKTASEAFDCEENPWGYKGKVCLNVIGREPTGIVPPENADKLREDLSTKLGGILLDDGTALMTDMAETDDGAAIEMNMTRLSVQQLDQKLTIGDTKVPVRDYLVTQDITGDHAALGIIAIAGDPVCGGCEIKNASLLDVAPTLLYLLGLPIADDMEGFPLTEVVDPRHLAKNPVHRVADYGFMEETWRAKTEQQGESEAEKELKDRLRALGYIR
jgi:predicted AlkP superfamily phosphohydrolase/phosphomutase